MCVCVCLALLPLFLSLVSCIFTPIGVFSFNLYKYINIFFCSWWTKARCAPPTVKLCLRVLIFVCFFFSCLFLFAPFFVFINETRRERERTREKKRIIKAFTACLQSKTLHINPIGVVSIQSDVFRFSFVCSCFHPRKFCFQLNRFSFIYIFRFSIFFYIPIWNSSKLKERNRKELISLAWTHLRFYFLFK